MEKVKLTREQAEAIERLRKVHHDSVIVARNVVLRERGDKVDSRHRKLFNISLHELIKALYFGYEVEETFEDGDWVVRTAEGIKYKENLYRKGRLFKIFKVDENMDCPVICEEMGYHREESLRHATPEEVAEEKQRRWWAKHGRKVWELREGDLLENINDMTIIEFLGFDQGALEYRIQSSYYREDILGYSKRYRVICFAEDRKDVK